MQKEKKEKLGKEITLIADLVIAATILFFWTTTIDSFNFPKQFVIATGIVSLVLVALLRDRFLINLAKTSRIELLLLTTLLILCLISLPHGLTSMTNFWGSFSRANGLLTKVVLLLVALVYSRYSSEKSINRFFNVVLVLLFLEVIYGFIQLNGFDPILWINPYNNIFVTTGNPNFAAALFAILVVLSTRFLFVGTNLRTKGFVVVLLVLGTYMSYATKSIQGIMTIAIGFFLLVVVWSLKRLARNRDKLLVVTGLSILGTPIALGVFNVGPLASFLYQETLSIRLHYWRVAMRIIRDNPLFGVGNDGYGDYYRLYRESWFVEKYSPSLISTNAHNVALQWGSDIGVLGVLIYFLFLALAIFTYISKFRSYSESKSLNDSDFLFIGFVAFYAQSLISISQLSVTCLGFALLGMLLSHNRDEKLEIPMKRKLVKAITPSSFVGVGTWWIVLCLALTPLTSTLVRKDAELRRAMQLPGVSKEGSDLEFRSKQITSAARFFREDQDYSLFAIDNLFNQGLVQYGLTFSEEVLSTNPNILIAYSAQIIAYSNSGQSKELIVAAENALQLDPLNYSIRFQYGKALNSRGRRAEANRELVEVLRQAPYSSSDFEAASSLLAEIDHSIERS